MPIDDVDYLKQHSIKQSFLILIDSKDRDHIAYPTPSSYSIDFTVPFYNVIGFQLMDASIPRTMYNVDITNNSFSFFIHNSNLDITRINPSNYIGADRSRTVDTGEYTIQTLITALNGNINNDPLLPILLQMHVNNDSNLPLAQITAQTLSNPPETKSVIQFTCSYPFVMDMMNSTISETIGFDLVVQPQIEITKPILEQRYTTVGSGPNMGNNQLYHSVDIPPNVVLGESYTGFSGPQGVVRSLSIGVSNYVAQAFTVVDEAYFTAFNAALYTSTQTNQGVALNQVAEWSLYSSSNQLPYALIQTSNYNIINGKYDILANSNAISLSAIDGSYSDTNTPFQVFLTPGQYWIVMTSLTDQNIGLKVFYNDIPTYANYQPLVTASNVIIQHFANNAQWLQTTDIADGVYFNASVQVTLQNSYHYLTAPGIYSLLGDRYIIVRCPEIEDHSYGSLAFTKHCLGIAKIKLGVIGYSDNSGDFASVPLREFHPIGKLPKLSFQFQRIDGSLYDFKGVNHTMTFAVYYYEPIQQKQFTQSILNPNYNGNFIEYMHSIEDEDEDSDDQEEDYSRDAPQNYQVVESRHMPETINRIDQEALYRFSLDNTYDDN